MGGHKKSHIFDNSQEFFGYFSHLTVLFCLKMIRRFIHQCKMQRGKELFLIKEGFEYISMLSGVIGI